MAITTRHQLLAWDLVEGLGDENHKGIYFRLAKIYNEAFLREILSCVKDVYNQGKIKSGDRGRYFMGILKKETSSFSANWRIREDKHIHDKHIKNNPRRRSGSKKESRSGKKSKRS